MKNRYLKLQNVLSSDLREDYDVKAFALESFAKDIDDQNQQELLTKLILDHASVAKNIEQLNKELSHSREVLAEAQEIALLGRWDINPSTGSVVLSKSMYDIFEIDSSTPVTLELLSSFIHPDDREQVTEIFQKM